MQISNMKMSPMANCKACSIMLIILCATVAVFLVKFPLLPAFYADSVRQLPKWNFWKFLVSAEGQVLKVWKPEEPMEEIRKEVTALVREIILKKRHEL